MKKIFLAILAISANYISGAQELFVYTESASNMPAHTITPKLAMNAGRTGGKWKERYVPELMFGFNKKIMVHLGATFSNTNSTDARWESIYIYGKYRFFSRDDVHKHFRMALFSEAGYSRSNYQYDELNLQGERSGIQLGLVATELINRIAVSTTLSHTRALDQSRPADVYNPKRTDNSFNYTFSAGYLLLPREYRSYKQLNVNLYTELLGQQTFDRKTFFVDLAPSLQFLFNSNSKLNLGYRFQLNGNQSRSMERSFLVSFEHTIFNALKH